MKDNYIELEIQTQTDIKAEYAKRIASSIWNESSKKPETKIYIYDRIDELESLKDTSF